MKKNKICNTFGYISCWSNSNIWEYTCCNDSIRIWKGHPNGVLTVPGVTYSIHFNTYCERGPKWIPKSWRNKASNHHIAFIKQFPFIVIGFDNVSKYMKYDEL